MKIPSIRYPQPEGVAAGGTVTCRIPVGRRIHALYFNYNDTNQDITDFTEFRLYLNGQVVQRFTGTERDKLNQFDGIAAAAGTLIIPFDRKDLIALSGREQTAINTGVADSLGNKISSVYLEVDILAGATIAASDLSLYGKESDPIKFDTNGKPYGPGVIPFIRREQRTTSGADTDFQISDLVSPGVNSPDKLALDRITFVPSAGTISNLKVERNQYTVFDRTDALNRVIQAAGIKTPISGYHMIDSKENGQGGDIIPLTGMTDYRYRLNVSAAATITCLSEYFGSLPNS